MWWEVSAGLAPLGAGRKSFGEAWQEGKKIEERKAAMLPLPGTAWTGSSAGATGRLLMYLDAQHGPS